MTTSQRCCRRRFSGDVVRRLSVRRPVSRLADNPTEPEAVAALIRRQEQEKYHRELMQKFGQPVAMLRQ